MKMNNIYLPDGFPNTPDVKALEGQYTAGDGIAIGSDGAISVDYGPGVTMTSTDKLTLNYGPGLDMTTTDKLTIKAGNGLQLSGDELAARIGTGLSFGENGAINGNALPQFTSEGVSTTTATAGSRIEYCVYGDIVFFYMDLVFQTSVSANDTLCTGMPVPASKKYTYPSFIGFNRSVTGSTTSVNAMFVADFNADGSVTIHNNMQLIGSFCFVSGFYKKSTS